MISKQYLKVLPSKLGGQGLFITIKLPANIPILEKTGDIFDKKSAPNHPALTQVGPNLFIGPSGGPDDYINHSCNPNCSIQIVGNRAIFYSMYVIHAESELTFDYSTSSTDSLDEWKMECNCGNVNCRKIISGLQYVSQETLENFKKNNMLPLFMKENIFK